MFIKGATVFCTARDLKKAEQALTGILEPGRVHLLHLDLESLDSVRACAKEFLQKSDTLNGLIANAGRFLYEYFPSKTLLNWFAGVMFTPEGRTADGFETHFGTNHLSHFLLFNLLKRALLAGSTSGFNSRVVIVSSIGHRSSSIHFDNINLEGEYKPNIGYGQSKTANIYMAWRIRPMSKNRLC
jgi:NAD(P)-dependent dehydrogenase (short-subunit alcohol dehydrogenase family)